MTTDIATLAIALETSSAIAQIQQLTSRLDSLRSQSIRLRNADPFPAMGRSVSAFNSTASRTSAVMKGITAAASKLTAVLAGVFAVSKIVAFGNESIRVFSDLEEETQKFGVVFSGMGKQAEKVVKELQESYGQSELSARRSLALTGDLLTGFGFDRKTALDMSEQVAKLGADIASFSNYAGGAEGAVAALTKGLLGETESMKMLGIAIRQDSDEFKNMVANIRTSTGASEAQAKAQAVLKLAYAQSGNAVGDFKRNMDSIANQSRVFGNSMLDLKSAVGGFLDELFHIAPLVGSLGEKVRSLSETIKANAGEWAATIQLFSFDVAEFAEKVGVWLEPLFTGISAGIQNTVAIGQWANDNFRRIFANIGDVGLAAGKNLLDVFSYVPRQIVSIFKELGVAIWDTLFDPSSAGEIFHKAFSQIKEQAIRDFAELGRETQIALAKAGVTAMPKLKNANYSAWTDPEYRKKSFAGIEERYNALRASVGKSSEHIAEQGNTVASAISGVANEIETAKRDFQSGMVTSTKGLIYGTMEAYREMSKVYDRDPTASAESKIKKSAGSVANALTEASGTIKNAVAGLRMRETLAIDSTPVNARYLNQERTVTLGRVEEESRQNTAFRQKENADSKIKQDRQNWAETLKIWKEVSKNTAAILAAMKTNNSAVTGIAVTLA